MAPASSSGVSLWPGSFISPIIIAMSQNGGFTGGFVAIERFLILIIYSKKIGTKRLCCNSEVVAIQRCRN